MTTEQTTHSIQWFGRIEPCPEFPEGLVPRTSMMQGRDWGWDVRCSCGWESRTGGAIQARVREMVAFHRYEIRNPMTTATEGATMTTKNVTMSLASDWAWSQVRSPNVNFDTDKTPIALIFLTYARLADEALDSPNGYSYSTFTEMAETIGLESYLEAIASTDALVRCGLLVRVEGGVRIPEEAFQS